MDSLTLLQMLTAQQRDELEIVQSKIAKLNSAIERIESTIEIGSHFFENAELLFRKNSNKTIILPYNLFQPMVKAPSEGISFLSFPDFSTLISEEFIQTKEDVVKYKEHKNQEVGQWKEILDLYLGKLEEVKEKEKLILKLLNILEIEMDLFLYNSFIPDVKYLAQFMDKPLPKFKNLVKELDLDTELKKDAALINISSKKDSERGQLALKSIIVDKVIKNFKIKYQNNVKSFTYFLRAIYRHLEFDMLPEKKWLEANFISLAQKRFKSVEE